MFKGTMTKWPVQKLTQGTTQNSYNIMTQQTFRQTIFCVFRIFLYFLFLLIISKTTSPKNVELPPWYGQCLSLGVLFFLFPFFSTFFGEEKERKNAFNLSNQAT